MDFIKELEWRGMLHDRTPGIKEHLATNMQTGYIGFDPTAPSLTIGNFVQIMLLKIFQLSGHQPIVLMGGATGRIGDPSGKDKERQLKSYDELDANLAHQVEQIKRLLDFENGDNKALLINNLDFYKEMNVLDFLRKVGKTLTVGYMTSKESVKRRLETGLSFTEFSYQLLQAYDFQCLYDQYNCTVQMGGSDQWGNITSGTEFIRRNVGGKAYAATTPLLTKADGSKFGKSEKGNIWLDANMTSPYKFYQFWLQADDRDTPKLMRYFTLKSKEEVEALEGEHANNPNALKRNLGEELTRRIHGDEAFEAVLNVTEMVFNPKAKRDQLMRLDVASLKTIAEEIPSFTVDKSLVSNGVHLATLLAEHTSVLSSKSDVRRAVKNNAIRINKERISNYDTTVTHEHLLHGKYILLENGKKNKFMVVAV